MTPSKTPTGAATGMPIGASRARARRNATGTATCCTWWLDATYELPLAFEVTEASRGEQPQAQWLLDQMQERHPELLERCSRLSADKGYDDHKLINRLWDEHQIKPIIAIRNCWKDGDAEDNGVRTKLVNGQENVIYTYNGEVSCMCPLSGEVHSMTYGGFERDRETLKYCCPARYSGITCKGMEQCPLAGKAVRIPLAEDRRVFTPVARSSYRWQDYYDERSAVERVNSRLAGGFGFERAASRWRSPERLSGLGARAANDGCRRVATEPPYRKRDHARHRQSRSVIDLGLIAARIPWA